MSNYSLLYLYMRIDIAFVTGLILFVLFCFISGKYIKEGLEGKKLGKQDPVGDSDEIDSERKFIKNGLDYYKRRSSLIGGNTMIMKFPELDNFYRYEEERPLGEQLVLDVMKSGKSSPLASDIDECRNLKTCNDIKNSNPEKGCGYCAKNDKFMIGNAEGPMANICPDGWSFTPEICKKNKEKAVCGNITSCLGVVQDEPTKICVWCPRAKKAYVSAINDGVAIPKYDDDKCDSPLFGGDSCRSDPICSAKYDSGPHSGECLRKIWKDAGCSAKSIVSSNMENPKDSHVIRWNSQSVPNVYKDMRGIKLSAEKCDVQSYSSCYGREKAREAQKLGKIGPNCQKKEIKGKVAAKRAIAEAKIEAARSASSEAYAARRAAQIILGQEASKLSCKGDEMWDVTDGGLFVDQRIRDCRKEGGKSSTVKRETRDDYS